MISVQKKQTDITRFKIFFTLTYFNVVPNVKSVVDGVVSSLLKLDVEVPTQI